jgi:hypothetical protein
LRRIDLIDGGLKFLAGGSDVLIELDFMVEMNDEGFVFVFAQQVIEKRAAGREFLIEDTALTHAGVDEQAKGEWEIGLFGEIGDGLRMAVLGENKVVFGEVIDNFGVFVTDGGEEIDGVDFDSDGSGLLAAKRQIGRQEKKAE